MSNETDLYTNPEVPSKRYSCFRVDEKAPLIRDERVIETLGLTTSPRAPGRSAKSQEPAEKLLGSAIVEEDATVH